MSNSECYLKMPFLKNVLRSTTKLWIKVRNKYDFVTQFGN